MKLKFLAIHFLLVLTFLSFFGSAALSAQSSTGTLEGTVLDGQKIPVFNALVTVMQLETKRTLKTRTTRAGVYSFPGLDAGTYEISVQASSFESETTTGITVDAGSDNTQDFSLHPGSNNASITVYSSADLVQRDNSGISNTVSQDLIENIPLPDHSSLGLVTLIPGVVGDPVYSNGVQSELPTIYTNPAIPGASLSMGGSRPGLVSQLIDGFDITQSGYPRAGVTFTPFAIKGLSAQMAAMQAEFGRTGGGIINQASQAGGSQYHGTFEYRHYDPGFGQAYRTGSNQPSDLHQTLYGGVISGPVGFPKWKKVKDTFFLFTYEPLRARSSVFSRARVLAPDELNGQFFNAGSGVIAGQAAAGNGDGFVSYDQLNTSQLIANGYQAAVVASSTKGTGPTPMVSPLNPIYNQYASPTVAGAAAGAKCSTAQGFPFGNRTQCNAAVIQSADVSAQVALNPLAQFVKAHYPTPTNPGKYITFDNALAEYGTDGNNSYAARGVVNHDDRYSIRLDHTFGNNDHMFARYTNVPVSGIRYNFLGPSNPLNTIATDTITSQNWAVNYIHLFGGHTVNESRVSYIRGYRYRIPPPVDLTQDYGPQFGLPYATAGVGFPALTFSDGAPQVGGGGGFQDGGRSLDEAYGYGNTTTIILGRHQLKFGVDFRALQLNRTDDSNNYGGTYLFSNQDTSGTGIGGTETGNAIASFDLGLIYTFTTAGQQPFYYRWKYVAGFIEDSWKASPTLTINYGLRYNLEYPRKEKYNLQGTFLPNVTGYPMTSTGAFSTQPATGGVARSGTNGLGESIFPVNYKGFEPRLGIAFSPRPWIVMKGGYALIHAPLTGVGNSIDPAFTPTAQVINQGAGGVTSCGAVASGCYEALSYETNPPAPITRVGAITNQNPIFSWTPNALLPYVNQNNAVPYVEIWSGGVQFLLSHATVMEVNYIGQRAIHLYSPALGTNLPAQSTLLSMQQSHFCFSCNYTPVDFGELGPETALQHLSPYTQFWNNPIYQTYNRTASSNYNGFYLSVKRQATKQLTLIGGFTWSKSLDTNSTPSPDLVQIDNFGLTYPQNAYTSQGDYGVSSFDQPARVTAGYTYNFPVGRGQRWFTHGILNTIFGGFTTSGYFSAQSGLAPDIGEGNNGFFLSQNALNPSGATSTFTSQQLGALGASQLYNHLRPNIIPGVPLKNPNWSNNKLGLKAGGADGPGYLNVLAFQAPGSRDNPAYGNAPAHLSDARSPRSINWDASVRKNFQIEGRFRMTLWTDILNAANHPNYFTVGGNVFSGSLIASQVFTAANPPNSNYPINGPFQNTTGFSIPSAFSGTRLITVGASISF